MAPLRETFATGSILHQFGGLDCLTLPRLWVTSKRAPPIIEGDGGRRFAAAEYVVELLCANYNTERSGIFQNEKRSGFLPPSHSFLFGYSFLAQSMALPQPYS